ncbi:hypothetical protein ACTFIR_001937 [Dictyostelium discoideum]
MGKRPYGVPEYTRYIILNVDIDIDIKSMGIDVCNYEDHDEYKSKLFDKGNEFKLIKINRDNEIKAIKLKEQDELSNQTKSILTLNSSTASYELNLKYANGNFINDHIDFDRIKTAEIQATIATQSRPVWGKSYFRLAKVKPRLSNYQYAIQLYDVALHLESFI